nr:MAG TPA: hypothetical protein [Caudoviricetes sp.]
MALLTISHQHIKFLHNSMSKLDNLYYYFTI